MIDKVDLKFLFKNKALTLFYLTKKFKNKINIPEFLFFKKNELKKNINIYQVLKKFNNNLLGLNKTENLSTMSFYCKQILKNL